MSLVTSEKKALLDLQTAEYIAQSRDFTKLMERHNELLGIIHVCTQTIDSLTDCLKTSGLEDLRSAAFKEWLCDIGMSKLQTALKDIDGNTLTMLHVSDVMEHDVTFADAAALQLRGYIAHYKLSNDSAFAPPRGRMSSKLQTGSLHLVPHMVVFPLLAGTVLPYAHFRRHVLLRPARESSRPLTRQSSLD